MKKNLFLLSLILALLVGGCAASVSETNEQTESAAETAQPTQPPTEAPTEAPDLLPSEVKVGMVFLGTENDGNVLAQSLRRDLTEAAVQAGMEEDQLIWKYNDREADWTQIEESILACVDEGCQLIFGGSREYEAVIAAIAEEYPDVMFACVGGSLMNGTNSGTFDISLAAAQYLCGAAAAAASPSGRIGFLAAKDDTDEEVTAGVNAFAYGAWSVNPDAVVDVGITGRWFLPEAETQGAEELANLGCDVIGGYIDGNAGQAAAAADGLYIVGAGVENADLYGDRAAAYVLYDWTGYFSMKISQVISRDVVGEAWAGDYYGGEAVFVLQNTSLENMLSQAVQQLAQWNPNAPETEAPETKAEEQTEPEQTEAEGQSEPEETAAPPAVDEETGYLDNVRIHYIEVVEPETAEAEE